jgi:YfiR/HmsC-like
MTNDRIVQRYLAGTLHQRELWVRRGCSILLVCVFLITPAWTQTAFTSSDVEAAYLYNFGKFVRWPADTDTGTPPFSICIVGDDPFGQRLDRLVANESIQGHPILMRRLQTVSAATACQIVFLGASEEPRLAKDLAELQKKPVLTVSSLPDFLDHGGMIQFLQINNKVRFAVNLAAAEQAGITFSSELLKVAVTVDSKASPEGQQ